MVRSRWRQRETGGAPGVEEGVARTLLLLFPEDDDDDDAMAMDASAAAAAEVSCRAFR